MEKYRLQMTDVIDDEAKAIIGDGLDDFNTEMAGIKDRQPLAVLVKDPQTGKVLGGMLGRTSLGLMFIELFYLPLTLRGSGLGSEILRQFEQEGARRGCTSGVLYTLSFQAPNFYAKYGWQRFGEIPCSPEGSSRIFMSKALTPQ
ncbi:GNAT family N-acetyltransferase [Rouxiella badensis]|jgi:GNAT superfamily N-acetyltransferase|uniref:GNAT family N-acetyltransferase n=1 Tax=Rouxiella badensis TaxID=1646377 RepID=A0A1X0WD13_9GAMM|nr:GNAT family N-acetyltransferase [Rouxiella badensis]MCC3702068.1 GNAT family N-acetyltransferase [Rouxiella badensis]MCC3717062.1 GNAT family N-acetyltransferase [Rouxiella badensis]MCC3728170.1 GNAT family N-acetyltransferase [Rouxiella badensis]MCC3732074.1 GNAT family N-acetyltransferase [Rouxiella badensis]MCC3739914.1 GNAT family N-acetyltransferase [Rouxiella badensis]